MGFVHSTDEVGPARVTLSAGVSRHGVTNLQAPPLGEVEFNSHRGPVAVSARIESIDLAKTQSLASSHDVTRELERDARRSVQGLVVRLLLKVLLLAVVVGAVAGLVMPLRSRGHVLAGIGGAVVTVLLLMAVTWSTYSVDSFAQPRFSGALERAPQALGAVRREYESIGGLQDRAQILASQLSALSKQAADPEVLNTAPDETVILHVSDIHSNPIGLQVAASLAEKFEVDAIVDTGDLTSFGLPIEQSVSSFIAKMPAPYYWVPGNHDSPTNRAALAKTKNLTLIDGEVVDVAGVRVLGFPDPAFTVAPDEGGVPGQQARADRLDEAPTVAEAVRRTKPDVLAVAGLQQAADTGGLVPLVISGDIHERSSKDVDGTLMLTVGSTGAGGLGSFTVETGRAYEAEVLHFVDGKLRILDYVSQKGLSGAFTIDRVVYDPDRESDTTTSSSGVGSRR
jgi:predicted phosphodiesterase